MANRLPLLFGAAFCVLSVNALAADAPIDFVTQVKPILASRCVICHQSQALFGDLNLENRTLAFKKRPGGPAILRGKPDSSPLYFVLRLPPKNPKAMPASGHRISDREMGVVYDWIKQGAEWPDGPEGVIPPAKAPKTGQ